MLKIKSPLFKLIAILFRQMNLSIARYSTEEDFYTYFEDKRKFYKYAIEELEKILDSYYDYYPLLVKLKNMLFFRRLKNLNVLLIYKVLKEFDEMLDYKDFHDMLYNKKTLFSTREIYWQVLRKKTPRRERKIIDETEHFGQNFALPFYKSIEETISQLNLQIEIKGK